MKDELLYLTADKIGTPTGGGVVTYNESCALRELALNPYDFDGDVYVKIVSRDELENVNKTMLWVENEKDLEREMQDPWLWDHLAYHQFGNRIKLTHVYAGTFSESIKKLKQNGAVVTYTAAAHDKELSRREHEKLGFPYAYPHMVDSKLWQRYLDGYLRADVLICPSEHSASVMRAFGATNRIAVIPHGVELPKEVAPLPKRFTVGYLGSIGPDKGLIYLLQAWKKLGYDDATLLIGGSGGTTQYGMFLIETYGGAKVHSSSMGNVWLGNISATGWVDDVSNFYNRISLYVQPSITEGFGIEVLEAMAHGRPVICSTGAGAVDVVCPCYGQEKFKAGNVEQLMEIIDWHYRHRLESEKSGVFGRMHADSYTWDKVRAMYKSLWKELLCLS